jgi:EAL domain-containing protein (putative c-di-GMP-specific phosphodiesterase class I)/GGDEF domain-containing protein
MNLCGLIEDTALRERLTLLAADAGWSCWLSDDAALLQRVLDTSHAPADLIVTDVRDRVALLETCAGRAPVVLLTAVRGTGEPAFSSIDPAVPDAELLICFRTCVNARRFRDRFADLDAREPVAELPRHDELLQGLARHAGTPLGLVVIQVDHAEHLFNQLDPVSRYDLLGTLGDQIRRNLPSSGVLGYYDPSCFVAALPGAAAEQVAATAAGLVPALRRPIAFKGGELHLTVSVGYAAEPLFSDAERIWSEAWRAMRRALAQHGNRALGRERNSVADRLPQALAREEFSLVLQPQVSVDGDRLSGAEVLLRWQGLEVGELSPSQFIPIAESRGYMARIGDWVLEHACRAAATWLENRIDPVRLSVNVSPQQFHNGAIVGQIERFRAERWLDPALLELEMPHDTLLHLVDAHREHLFRLRDLGVRFALDNLGGGLLDAARLLRTPADTLKIDRTIVERMDTDPNARELAEGICQLGRRFDLRVVAVGVERESQLAILRQAGCTDAQGFLFSPAVSLAQFRELLARGHARHRSVRQTR